MQRHWRINQKIGTDGADVTGCDFSNNSLAAGLSDRTVRLFERSVDNEFIEKNCSPLVGHTYALTAVRFAPSATQLCSASVDGTCIVWNSESGCRMATLRHPSSNSVRCCTFSPSETMIATGSDDETLLIWDAATHYAVRTLSAYRATVTCCAFSPDSCFVIMGTSEGLLQLFTAVDGKCLVTRHDAHDLSVLTCDFYPRFESNANSTVFMIASGGNDDLLRIWRFEAENQCHMTLIYDLRGHSGNIMAVRFSPNGATLASSGGDKAVIVWDAIRMYKTTGSRCLVPTYSEYFGPGETMTLKLQKHLELQYEAVVVEQCNGEFIQRLEGHQSYIACCAFSVDGMSLATGSNDRTLVVWSLDESEKREPLSLGSEILPSATSMCRRSVARISQSSEKDAALWRAQLRLENLLNELREQDIDGEKLLHLTHECLTNTLGVDTLGHYWQQVPPTLARLKNAPSKILTAEHNALLKECACPITDEVMHDPVVAADGYSYERSAIARWFESGKGTSPLTNEPLGNTTLIPNKTLCLLLKKLFH